MNRNPLKRLISFTLSLFMTFSIIFADNAIITAFAEETNVKTYNYDNFKVEYIIDSEWEGAQSVRIKISNTGDETILNWYLKYNTSGAIENIYNATVYSESNGEYILKHNGYNYEIGAGDSVELGYILKGDDLAFPEEFKMCNKRVEKESGYTVNFNIISEWDAGFNADIVITNDTDSPIEAWTLAFDSNFNINNYWNCKLISNESDRYNFANQVWTTPIPAGGTASFGFTADKIDGAAPIAENWVLTEVVIDLSPIVEPQSFNIFGFVEYAADSNSLLISWISEYDEGIFEIYTSNDGITFEKYTEVSNCSSYTYAVTEDFDKKYFIIKQILDNGNIGESSIILITKGKNGYSMEFPDSDSDGVADYLEEAFGLDINKTDTDDDGLSDYEEMFITGTDPTVYDSVKKGVSDAEADSDNDGLTNKQELSIGTNPVIPDSDGDNLTDGDEVNKYGTNPLIPDSDDDKINDGDEIKLGLDPLNPNTFGVPDSEYTFNVELTDNSDAMSEINTSDNEYKLSIELKAAGNVSENISVTESNYSETIKNSAIIGKSFDIEYDEACKVDEVVIKFTLNEDTITESELGIERYCVFKLFEEYNILLPVYTEYDLNNGKLSSQVDEVGTYCLMDMEKLVDSFCSASETQEIEQSTEDVQPIMLYSSRNSGVWQNGIDKSSINVVFILDIRDNIDDESFENIKTNIVKTAAEVLKESSNAKIYLLLQHYDKVSSNMLGYTVLDDDEQEFFTDSLKIYNALDEIRTNSVDDVNSYCILSDAIKYVYDNCDNSNGTYCFSIFDSADVVYRTSLVGEEIIGVTGSDDYGYEVLNKLRENTIDVSVISNIAPEYNLGYAIDLYDSTGGIYIDGFGDISDEMLKHIYGYVPNNDKESTIFFNGMSFEEMKLESPITKEYLNVAKELEGNLKEAYDNESILAIREKYNMYADSDDDGLYDFEEVDIFNSMIEWNMEGDVILPTIEDYCKEINNEKVIKAMEEYIDENWNSLLSFRVAPIKSDPMSEDGDKDGLLDGSVRKNKDGNIIAPKDQNPLNPDGPTGMWLNHIQSADSGVPHELDGWYKAKKANDADISLSPFMEFLIETFFCLIDGVEWGLSEITDSENLDYILEYTNPSKFIDLSKDNSGIEGIKAAMIEIEYLANAGITNFKNHDWNELEAQVIAIAYATISNDESAYWAIQQFLQNVEEHIVDTVDVSEVKTILSVLGAQLLNFKADTMGENVHSQMRTWQAVGGYSNLYDDIFSTFTKGNMRKEKFAFTTNDGMEYILWAWRGDYLNLGAGAEVGIYSRPVSMHQDPEALDHYFADYELAMPMSLYLYDYSKTEPIKQLVAWEPTEKQWWITGFNPSYFGNVDASKQVMICSVDFSQYTDRVGNNDMYERLKNTAKIESDFYNNAAIKYCIFDDINKTVWIMWYEEALC